MEFADDTALLTSSNGPLSPPNRTNQHPTKQEDTTHYAKAESHRRASATHRPEWAHQADNAD